MKPCLGGWLDDSMPIKKEDPSRSVISIAIGQQQFDEVIYDIGSSVNINIIPKVIYNNVLQFGPLLHMTKRLRFVDRSTHRVKGITDNICMPIWHSYVPTYFVVLDTGQNPNAPIILGRPFLHTTNATIYVGTTEVYFYLGQRIERFPFYHPVNASIQRVRTRRSSRRAPRSGGLNNIECY
jgi:hypothetical protein